MKKFTFLLFLLSISFSQKSFSQELKSEFLFDLDISLNAPQMVGQVLKGTRMIFPFRDGTVKGSKINGKIINTFYYPFITPRGINLATLLDKPAF